MQPTIFISRDESRCQAFIDIIKPVPGQITCQSLIDFSMIKGGALPKKVWLFFYSQTGVDYFLQQYDLKQIESNDVKIAAFGPKTGQYMQNQHLNVDFIGTGEAKTTAERFLLEEHLSEVCFIQGANSKNSIASFLKPTIITKSIIVYGNKGKEDLHLPPSDILVFTSPLNLETYYKHYAIDKNQKVVVIGSSTAVTALDIGIEEVHISSIPAIESLAALVVQLCDTWSSSK